MTDVHRLRQAAALRKFQRIGSGDGLRAHRSRLSGRRAQAAFFGARPRRIQTVDVGSARFMV
jgi:hypothetical protein